MKSLLISSLWPIVYFQSISSVKIASFNTYQIFDNVDAGKLLPQQVPLIGQSDTDIYCLQELMLPANIAGYTAALSSFGYTHSFSVLDVESKEAGIGCSADEIASINQECTSFCSDYYDASAAFGICLATACPDIYESVIYTQCSACIGLFAGIQPNLGGLYPLTLEGALTFCASPPSQYFGDFVFDINDGIVIVSKDEFPILNTWSYELPSWLFVPRRLQIAEISICSETAPNDADCSDSIIVGCVHLEATGWVEDRDIVQSPTLNDDSCTSHIGLNRLQTQHITDNYYNNDILRTLGIANKRDNIYGVFLMGDTNNGQLFNRCDWRNEDDEVAADNCEGEEPSNPFDLFIEAGFVDGPDINYKGPMNDPNVKCTVCKDPQKDDYNLLAVDDPEYFIDDEDTSRDLDHILIQNGYCHNFDAITFEREFMDEIVSDVIDNELVTVSDHYGISLDIKFGGERGGRRHRGQCLGRNRPKHPKGSKQSVAPSSIIIEISKSATYSIIALIIFLLILNIICLSGYYRNGANKKQIKYSKVVEIETSEDDENVNLKN